MNRDIWNSIVKENMDISDRNTLKVMTTINESDQNQVVANLANKLYESIVSKVTDIDFGSIPGSKGDITKIPNYHDICTCLTTIRDLLIENRQSTEAVDIIFSSIEYLKRLRPIFEKGYNIECELVIITYNTISLSIVSASSILLSSMIEFIKDPNSGEFQICLSKIKKQNSKDGLLFKNLNKFNKACSKGEIEKSFDAILKAQRNIKESGVITEGIFSGILSTITILSLATCIIPIIHQLINMLMCLRQRLSDYFSVESDIIKLNAEHINYDYSKSEESRKKIIEKQMKIADNFKSFSNKLAIKVTKAEAEAKKEIEKDISKKYKVDELMDEIPNSAMLF